MLCVFKGTRLVSLVRHLANTTQAILAFVTFCKFLGMYCNDSIDAHLIVAPLKTQCCINVSKLHIAELQCANTRSSKVSKTPMN